MPAMLRHLNLRLEGRHHSGIGMLHMKEIEFNGTHFASVSDDCKNIARIMQRMIADGYKPAATWTELPPSRDKDTDK